jgi:hypothetical protein
MSQYTGKVTPITRQYKTTWWQAETMARHHLQSNLANYVFLLLPAGRRKIILMAASLLDPQKMLLFRRNLRKV